MHLDDRIQQTPGWKFNEWELKGVPLRVEIGPKEVQAGEVVVARRDNQEKMKMKKGAVKKEVKKLLEEIQKGLLSRSSQFLKENTFRVDDYGEFKKVMKAQKGFLSAFWCESRECEDKIKEETKATNRCLPMGTKKEKGKCVYCGKESAYRWLFGQAY